MLAVPDQTAKPLQLHRQSRVTIFPTGFGYCMLWKSLYTVSTLNGLALPKQLTVLLSKREGPMSSLSNNVLQSPLLFPLSGFCDYEEYVIKKNGIRKICSKKRVCRIMF